MSDQADWWLVSCTRLNRSPHRACPRGEDLRRLKLPTIILDSETMESTWSAHHCSISVRSAAHSARL